MSLQLGLFVRPPVPGRTKTRLIPALGAEGACALYQAFLDDVGATVGRLRDKHPDVALMLWSADSDPGDALRRRAREWGAGLSTQVGDDLGARMRHALVQGVAAQGAALVLGTDAPTLPLAHLLAARAALVQPADDAARAGGRHPVGAATPLCLGPVADGGYIAVGCAGAPPSFTGVRMSTPHAFTDTVRANAGRPLARLAPWYDVDTPSDLRLLRLHLALDPAAAPASASVLRRLVSNLGVEPETC